MIPEEWEYDDIQDFFTESLPDDADLFNQYHALIVNTGHHFCAVKSPRCGHCPLAEICNYLPEAKTGDSL